MEAGGIVSAQEERRKKLLEYLAAKGKLKPQNNQKSYLRDATNVQNKRLQPPPKQVYEKKNEIPVKGKVETNKNKTSVNGPLQKRLGSGTLSAQQNISCNRPANQALPKKPVLSKQNVSRGRSAQIVQGKNVELKDNLAARRSSFTIFKPPGNEDGRGEQPDISLTVILSKIQHGDKTRISDVHIVDQSLSSGKRESETKQMNCIEMEGPIEEPPMLHESAVVNSVNRPSQMQALKQIPAPHGTKSHSPPGKSVIENHPANSKPLATTSTGHIRIVSQLSQPASKNGTATARSFLIKSFRGNGAQSQQPKTVKSGAQKSNCTTKLNPATHSAPLSVIVQKNIASTTKTGKYNSSNITKKASDVPSRHSVSKPAVCQTSTGPVDYNKTVKPRVSSSNQAKGANCKQTHSSTTLQDTGKATSCCMTASDSTWKPHTPKMTVEDRRKKLQEWLSSKGKTYKRPPMVLPLKRPTTAKKTPDLYRSVWEGIEEEEELLILSKKITQALDDCLELIDKGVSAEDIHAALDKIPEGKRFAKYWMCKAKLLEKEGIFDVLELYKQGVQCGAEPIHELREVVFNIMKNTNRKSRVVTFGPLPIDDFAEKDQKDTRWHATPAKKRKGDTETPGFTKDMCDQGSLVKFQVACVSSKKKSKSNGSDQEWKCLTPVRRSLRIHQSASQYPEVVQEHDTVVTCLDELLDMADTEAYLYVRNEALPEEADHTILGMVKQDSSEDQNQRPV